MPGTNWILTLVVQPPHGLWQIVDRSGKVADHVVNACTCGGIAATDAVWLARAGDGLEESVVRIAIDRANGHFATRQDTMTHGVFTAFSLTGDGAKMVMDDGTFDHSVWALPLADAMKGTLPRRPPDRACVDRRRAQRSPPTARRCSCVARVPTAAVTASRYSIMPFEGGAETPLPAPGNVKRAQLVGRAARRDVDARAARRFVSPRWTCGRARSATCSSFPTRWSPTSPRCRTAGRGSRRAAIASSSPRQDAGTSTRRRPGSPVSRQLTADPATRRVFYVGFGRATGDSAGVAALTLDDGKSTLWATHFAEDARVFASSAHAVVFAVATTQDSWSLFGARRPGRDDAARRDRRTDRRGVGVARPDAARRSWRWTTARTRG